MEKRKENKCTCGKPHSKLEKVFGTMSQKNKDELHKHVIITWRITSVAIGLAIAYAIATGVFNFKLSDFIGM